MFKEIQFSSLPEGQDINTQARKYSCKYNELKVTSSKKKIIKDFQLPEGKVQ